MTENVDVLVVGAGPTGTTLAGDLARRGRRVTVLERRPERHPASRAFAVMPRTLELLESRGLAQRLVAGGATTPGVDLWNGARLRLDRLDSPFPFALITPQTHVDAALEERAVSVGARIARGAEMVAIAPDADGVVVTTRSAGDGSTATHRATYVVAADGAHSTVRDLLGVPFPGRRVLSSVALADVRLARPPAGRGLTVGAAADVFGFLAPYGDGWFRSMTWDRRATASDHTAVSLDEVDGVLRRARGRDVAVAELGWHSRFHSDERQVHEYRHGRVFLAGDAAHVHSPLGGQGMNTGIQDAVNLAWKLDAALGGAADAVLGTYQRERHPVGRRVVFQSGALLRAVTLRPRLARAARDTVGSKLLPWDTFSAAVAGSFSGVTLRYHREHGDDRLVGTRAVTVPLQGAAVTARLGDGDWLLVRDLGRPPLDVELPQAERTDAGPALLVRPDGHVAWAGDLDAVAPGRGWPDAFARWTGWSPARVGQSK